MRNIFLFIRRYANFLLFLVLQIIALLFLFRYNKTHEAAFNGLASEVTGSVNERYNRIQYYFRLQKTNELLVQENRDLRALLRSNYESVDTAQKWVVDSVRIDSLLKFRKYRYLEAKVVGSFVSTQTNYFTLHRGSDQGVEKDMGVIGPNGIVGRVVNTSPNFSTVMSVLNRQFKVDAKLKKSGERGRIEWEGDDPQHIYMRNIPKSTKLLKGDSVLTSELSSIFPPNIMVGTVEAIINDKSSNFFTIKLKTATNFLNVQYVYVVANDQKVERETLEQNTKND